MADRAKAVSQLLLNAIGDDYESLEEIRKDVARWAEDDGIEIPSDDEIGNALNDLVTNRLAQAYALSATEPYAQATSFSRQRLDSLWFFAAPSGREKVQGRET